MSWEELLKGGPLQRMYKRMLTDLWELADSNPDNPLSAEINRITNRRD
jgi:hypothetical protein